MQNKGCFEYDVLGQLDARMPDILKRYNWSIVRQQGCAASDEIVRSLYSDAWVHRPKFGKAFLVYMACLLLHIPRLDWLNWAGEAEMDVECCRPIIPKFP